jgi:hypothetical protein
MLQAHHVRDEILALGRWLLADTDADVAHTIDEY